MQYADKWECKENMHNLYFPYSCAAGRYVDALRAFRSWSIIVFLTSALARAEVLHLELRVWADRWIGILHCHTLVVSDDADG